VAFPSSRDCGQTPQTPGEVKKLKRAESADGKKKRGEPQGKRAESSTQRPSNPKKGTLAKQMPQPLGGKKKRGVTETLPGK